MAVLPCLQSFCIFRLKCSVINLEVGRERSESNQPVVVFLPGGGKRAQPYSREPSGLYLPQDISVLYSAYQVTPLQPVENTTVSPCPSCAGRMAQEMLSNSGDQEFSWFHEVCVALPCVACNIASLRRESWGRINLQPLMRSQMSLGSNVYPHVPADRTL